MWRSDQGATAVVFAIMAPVIIGGLALGAETGYWFYVQSTLQTAADVSAQSVGVNLRKGASDAELKDIALRIAAKSGFKPDLGDLEVNIPPASGKFRGVKDYAEVVVTEHRERLFSSIFVNKPIEIGASSTVTVSGGTPLCVLSLSDARSALQLGTLAYLAGEGCGIAVNSTAQNSINGNFGLGQIKASCVQTAGGISGMILYDYTPCGDTVNYAAPVSDPYLVFDEIDTTHLPCTSPPTGRPPSGTQVAPQFVVDGVPVTKFCSTLELRGTYSFAPGLYVFEGGGLNVSAGSEVRGSEVSFFFRRNATLKIARSTLSLTAPTSGPYRGVLFASNRNDSVAHDITLSDSSLLTGALYFPKSAVTFNGGRNSHCSQLIAGTLKFANDTRFNSNCVSGQKPLMAGATVMLVE